MNLQDTFAAALLDPHAPLPACLRAWNGSDVAKRFAVHRNNVVVSLTRALADTFPVVQSLVGAEFFAAMAGVFVREQPPRSPVLAEFGAGFPAFIDAFAPARPLPYLGDVARLEMARLEAFHAADAGCVTPAAIRQALGSGARMAHVVLELHPSLRLVRSPHPVVSLWAAHQGEGELASIDLARAEAALVLRPELEVLVVPVPAPAAAFVASLQQGLPLGDSAAEAAAAHPGFDLAATLGLLLHHRALSSIRVPAGDFR